MPWISRGLRNGVLTTGYPRRADGYEPTFRGAVEVAGGSSGSTSELTSLCPTGAITADAVRVEVDRGRCILCGRCVAARPDVFSFTPEIELATPDRALLVVPPAEDLDDTSLRGARAELAKRVSAFRRSVHVRHVDAGSDGAEEWEVAALTNPVYDVQRLGVFFTASPRHADLLLVTGAGAAGMREPLRRTFEAMPEPKLVLAVGTDAISGGLVHPGYATRGGVASVLPVDVFVPGSPPSPFTILHAIISAVGMLTERSRR